MGPEETSPHLFVMRIWIEPAETPARLSRGIIEHVPTGERRYFRDLNEIQAFVTDRLSTSPIAREESTDAR